jgi:hypothetical protein
MLKATRLFVAAIALALVLVPTITRAQQHVEHRDATRLSIKHSWIGVAPPTKAVVAPLHAIVLPVLTIESEPAHGAKRRPVLIEPALHPVLELSPDPLRGPPSVSV